MPKGMGALDLDQGDGTGVATKKNYLERRKRQASAPRDFEFSRMLEEYAPTCGRFMDKLLRMVAQRGSLPATRLSGQ